jgi:hypothetical protein
MLSLTVLEWEDPKTKEDFRNYVAKYYPDKDLSDILAGINKYLE